MYMFVFNRIDYLQKYVVAHNSFLKTVLSNIVMNHVTNIFTPYVFIVFNNSTYQFELET